MCLYSIAPIIASEKPIIAKPGKRLGAALSLLFALAATPTAFGQEEGDWKFRLGVVNIDPEVSTSPVTTLTSGQLNASGIGFDADSQVNISITYMLANNFALEANVSAPFEHKLSITGLDRYGLNTSNLGEVKQISPGLSGLYYFGSSTSKIRPYIGAGFNYTKFFDDSLSAQARAELGAEGLELDEHFGFTARAGVDFQLGNGWFLNASMWRMNIDTNASFNSRFGPISTYAEMDPWVYQLSIGHDFSW